MRKRNGDSSQCETEIIDAKTTGSDQNTCVCASRLCSYDDRATDQLSTRCNVKKIVTVMQIIIIIKAIIMIIVVAHS